MLKYICASSLRQHLVSEHSMMYQTRHQMKLTHAFKSVHLKKKQLKTKKKKNVFWSIQKNGRHGLINGLAHWSVNTLKIM